ncbi:hypothetical protein ACSNOI_37205 [Actinomadura kijaniata]|uniref:hypothetical protein n=1 Tax=Actinomadura kijaniata TaxID=46161 RepID=UPI003F1C497A
MDDSGAGAAAPMSREGVDHALAELRDERDRISASLLELERHDGLRLLDGADLTGETWRRWDEARARVALLWKLFDAYGRVLEAAAALRAAHPRPDPAVLDELTALLTGPSVEVPGGEVPLERRTLLGPPRERVTLGEAVRMMETAYERSAEVVAAADAAWSALLVPLEETEEAWRAASRLVRELQDLRDPELDRLGRELTAIGRLARTDPLSLVRDGRADTSRLDRLRRALERRHAELAEAVALRDAFDERAARLAERVAAVAEAEEGAAAARDRALQRIEGADPPEPPDHAAALRERLGELTAARGRADWTALAGRVADLERAVDRALELAHRTRRLSEEPLGRRDELRGRLEAYRAKAARLGLAEDDGLARAYETARDALWTAPCDLRRAADAVTDYQRAIRARAREAGSRR